MKDQYVVMDLSTGRRLCKYDPKEGYTLTHGREEWQIYTNIFSARSALLRASKVFPEAEFRVGMVHGENIDSVEVLGVRFKRGAKSRPIFIFNSKCRRDFRSVQACANHLNISEERIYKAIRQGTTLEIAGSTYYADYAI
ncbi:MAG: hypothetical protein ACTTJW_01130 [Sphaerochaeta sp.]